MALRQKGDSMQIVVSIRNSRPLRVPQNYNYRMMNSIYDVLLGDEGYMKFLDRLENRPEDDRYRYFTFSPLKGGYRMENDVMILGDAFFFELRTPSAEFGNILKNALFDRGKIDLFDSTLEVRMVKVYERRIIGKSAEIRSVTPVVVSEHLPDGKIEYFSPDHLLFRQMINYDLKEKFRGAMGHEPPSEVSVDSLIKPEKVMSKIVENWVTGYNCRLRLSAHPQVLDFLYNIGLGNRNSLGFGMFERI
jgi:CRISPR-associated endoribonuclease Cas6